MIRFPLFLSVFFQATASGFIISEGLLLILVLLMIAIIVTVFYLITVKYKQNFGFERNAFTEEINYLKVHNENLKKELDFLKLKLDEIEKERRKGEEEKEILLRKIKDLEDQLLSLTKTDNTADEDIIIEYYMNKRSGE